MQVSHFLSGTKIRHNFFENPTFAMWFILALVFYRLTTRIIVKLPNYILVVALISLFADYFPQALLDVGDFPRIFSFMIYYFIGVKLRETNYDLRKLVIKPQYAISGFVLVSLLIMLININYYQPVAELLRQTNVDFFRSLTISQYIGSRMIAMVLALVNGVIMYSLINPQKWLIYIGKQSFSIYLGHVFFILILKTSTYQQFIESSSMPIVVLIIGLEIMTIIAVILYINNKYQLFKSKVLVAN